MRSDGTVDDAELDARPTDTVSTPNGPQIAVHRLGVPAREAATLISHANGFHGRCYRALADALPDATAIALDHRGHGLTPLGGRPDDVDWRPLGDDVLAVARTCFPAGAVVGFGHSMGGAALLMAAHRDPACFERLVLFEPVAPPRPTAEQRDAGPEDSPLVRSARYRRAVFESVEAAVANYGSKPPLSVMRADVLDDYVRFGTRPIDGGVRLRCEPEVEAAYFRTAAHNGVRSILPEIEVPTLVVTGHREPEGPAAWGEEIAASMPRGEFRIEDDLTHFGPFSHPERVAAIVDEWRPVRHR